MYMTETIELSYTDEEPIAERKPIPGLVGETWNDSPVFQNRDVWRLYPNMELDPDYPSNDPYGLKSERHKLWSGVAVRRKGDPSKRYLIKEEGDFSFLGLVYHYPGYTIADYYMLAAGYFSSDENLNLSESAFKTFFEGEVGYTLASGFYYAVALCAKEGLITISSEPPLSKA